MAPKKPKVGDTILWYGFPLTIYELEKLDDDRVRVKADDQGARERRRSAKERIQKLREKQVELGREDAKAHRELAEQIREISGEALQAIVNVGIRMDRLAWWEEKECWVKDGHILTDDQRAAFCLEMGLPKVRPAQERKALIFLESQGHPSTAEPPTVTRKEG